MRIPVTPLNKFRTILSALIFFAIFILGFGLNNVFAMVVLDDHIDEYSGDFDLYVLEDINQEYTIDDILNTSVAKQFKSIGSGRVDAGFTNSVYWLKFSVHNPYNNEFNWILEIAYPMLDSVQIFYVSRNMIESHITGDSIPFTDRQSDYRNFLLPLTSLPFAQTDYYLRVQSSSSMNIPLKIWSPKGIDAKIDAEQIVFGCYFGAMGIMILYNLLLYLSLRMSTYLYYVMFMSVSALFLFTLYGFSYKYLWPESVWWANNCLPFLIFLCNIFCVVFARSFLETKTETPVFDRVLYGYILLNICFWSGSLFFDYRIMIKISTLLAVFAAFLPMTVAFTLFMRSGQARFYLLAWSCLLFGIIVYGLKSYGILPNTPMTEYSMVTGLIVEVILLSFGIAARINTIKNEHMAAQKSEILTQKLAFLQQQTLTTSFERFVPKRFLNLLEKSSINDVKLGDHVERKMSVLFVDIRQFTNMSEMMTPAENFQFINSYLKKMEPIIETYNGVVDKFIGDAIMALFDDANEALLAGTALLAELKEYNHDRAKDGLPPISVGVGINTGYLMLGTIGAKERMDGTVIGQAVNIASRVESLTKEYNTSMLISDDTYQELLNPEQYQMQVIDKVIVKGKKDPITVWEVFPTTVKGELCVE